MSDNYYTLKEISLKIKTPVLYLRKMIRPKQLKAHFIGKQYVVNEEDLIFFIKSRGIK